MVMVDLCSLPQFDPMQYGQGLCRNATKVNQTAGLAESVFIVNALDILEPSSVKIEGTDAEWIHKTIEHALAASEDVPTIKEALHSTEKHD
ncbi:hypothetical protein C0995_010833 [Termitomyces sp. Mi166|nr:hypothetical protein C0995_010833 [Termitomyces sp. Mi166\